MKCSSSLTLATAEPPGGIPEKHDWAPGTQFLLQRIWGEAQDLTLPISPLTEPSCQDHTESITGVCLKSQSWKQNSLLPFAELSLLSQSSLLQSNMAIYLVDFL